ncbi:hypothetical protein EBU95_13190 [bacterium]|nr:hypothetical protein [bacterium]
MFTFSEDDSNPTATIKITFDDLSEDAKSFLVVCYVLTVTVTVFLNIRMFDMIFTRARLLLRNRTYNYEQV